MRGHRPKPIARWLQITYDWQEMLAYDYEWAALYASLRQGRRQRLVLYVDPAVPGQVEAAKELARRDDIRIWTRR